MTTRQVEIFQLPLDDLDLAGLPARSWQAVVAVDDAFVRVVAVPERGVEPKAYVLGLPVKEGEGGAGGTLH